MQSQLEKASNINRQNRRETNKWQDGMDDFGKVSFLRAMGSREVKEALTGLAFPSSIGRTLRFCRGGRSH
jgi:hypothetical protein